MEESNETKDERQELWEMFEKLELDFAYLKIITQKPMGATKDIHDWEQKEVKVFIENLLALVKNIKKFYFKDKNGR